MAEAVEAIARETETEGWITVTIEERATETFRQQRRGRPNSQSLYVKRETMRFELTCAVDHARLAEAARCDGIFPLISNDLTMTAKELLLAYKHQPMIEKRFAQLKTDFAVAPVYLKEVSRIQACSACTSWRCWWSRSWSGSCGERWTPGDRQPAAVPRGACVPPADGAEGDRSVRGRATA